MPELPAITGISDVEVNAARDRWDTISTVLEKLAAKGIIIPDSPPPFDLPDVTTTLVDTDNQEYLKTNAKYLAWLNYIMPNIALIEGVILQVRNEKSNIEALYRDNARRNDEGLPANKRQTKEEIADNTVLDPRYVELVKQEQELLQERDILDAKKEEVGRVLRVISRHIEVKKLDVEANRMASNLPQRRPFNKAGFGGGQESGV
jgi:hypothetical protein